MCRWTRTDRCAGAGAAVAGDGSVQSCRAAVLRGDQRFVGPAYVRCAGEDGAGGDENAIKALEKMASFLGRGLRMIASALAPNEIIIVGDITTAWYMFGPHVEAELKQNSLSKVPKIRPSFEGNTARLRSAVALVMNGNSI
jgi:predicted NBD/HSP70 family sugar kinase